MEHWSREGNEHIAKTPGSNRGLLSGHPKSSFLRLLGVPFRFWGVAEECFVFNDYNYVLPLGQRVCCERVRFAGDRAIFAFARGVDCRAGCQGGA